LRDTTLVNGTILAPDDAISVSTELGPNYKNYTDWGTINGALIAGKDIYIGCLVKIYFYPFTPPSTSAGSCLNGSSLAVLEQGPNVTAYVPKASWFAGTTGVSAINIEGSSITPTDIATANNVNSCAANPATGQIVCTSNGTDVYLLSGTSLVTTLTSGATGEATFSGGTCETCGVTMNPLTNQALLTEGNASGGGAYQFLDLNSNTFETPFNSERLDNLISEEVLIDPTRNLILSPNEAGGYEIVNVATTTSPTFFENNTFEGQTFDSAAEECSTGIALASDEFTNNLYIADLMQATFTAGSPGSWAAPEALDAFAEFDPFVDTAAGTTGISIAQGSHIGIVTSEFGGNNIAAIQLPATSGSGTPAFVDDVYCTLPNEPDGDVFSQGLDPHTVSAYVSPNTSDAIGLAADGGPNIGTPSYVAVVDLTKMLNTSVVPRTAGTNTCSAGVLPSSVVSYVVVP
jgi:hypothetical protein